MLQLCGSDKIFTKKSSSTESLFQLIYPTFLFSFAIFFQTKKLHQAAIHNINNAINGHLGADILKNHLCKKVDAKQIQKVEKTEKAVEIKL